jgi:hypothetical protein
MATSLARRIESLKGEYSSDVYEPIAQVLNYVQGYDSDDQRRMGQRDRFLVRYGDRIARAREYLSNVAADGLSGETFDFANKLEDILLSYNRTLDRKRKNESYRIQVAENLDEYKDSYHDLVGRYWFPDGSWDESVGEESRLRSNRADGGSDFYGDIPSVPIGMFKLCGTEAGSGNGSRGVGNHHDLETLSAAARVARDATCYNPNNYAENFVLGEARPQVAKGSWLGNWRQKAYMSGIAAIMGLSLLTTCDYPKTRTQEIGPRAKQELKVVSDQSDDQRMLEALTSAKKPKPWIHQVVARHLGTGEEYALAFRKDLRPNELPMCGFYEFYVRKPATNVPAPFVENGKGYPFADYLNIHGDGKLATKHRVRGEAEPGKSLTLDHLLTRRQAPKERESSECKNFLKAPVRQSLKYVVTCKGPE